MASEIPMSTIDPVCGKEVANNPDAFWADYEGRTYFFDSIACREEFKREPSRYAVVGSA